MKNNFKYIILISIGFFWCSGIYLCQEQILLKSMSVSNVNLVSMFFANISMAFGILLFIILYRKKCNLKRIYIIFLLLSILLSCIFFFIESSTILSIILCLICLISSSGFGIAYHFSLISERIPHNYRGKIFGISYALGSIMTYLITQISNNFYMSPMSLYIYIPCIIINLFLIKKEDNFNNNEAEEFTNTKKYYLREIIILIILMSIVSAISSSLLDRNLLLKGYNFSKSRIFYFIGLIIVGFLADNKKINLELLTIISLFYPLLTFTLIKEGLSFILVYELSYIFLAFFVLYRTIIFMDLSTKNIISLSALGLMISRIFDGLFTLVFSKYQFNNLVYIIVIVIAMSIIIIRTFNYKEKTAVKILKNNPIKELVAKYKITGAEERVLELLLKNYTYQEIADQLNLSVYTIKNHVKNIYKKTNLCKKDLKTFCVEN